MPAPTITSLPTAPQRSDEPATFVTRADDWVAAIDGFTDDVNAFGDYLNGLALSGISGPITGTSLTMATARLLGRTTASTGAIEEISVGARLSFASGSLNVADPAIQSVTSSATVTPTFSNDQVNITAQAAGLTLANPTGTAVDGWGLSIRIKDNGTARSITFGSQYRAIGVTLPTTTVISKTLYLGLIYNSADTKWDVVAVAQEA